MPRRRTHWPTHPWQTHGGYSRLRQVAAGKLNGRSAYGQALGTVARRLAEDVAGGWPLLTDGPAHPEAAGSAREAVP